jgi:hypothetical protein
MLSLILSIVFERNKGWRENKVREKWSKGWPT